MKVPVALTSNRRGEAQLGTNLCPTLTLTTAMLCLYDWRSGEGCARSGVVVLRNSSHGLHIRSSVDRHVLWITEYASRKKFQLSVLLIRPLSDGYSMIAFRPCYNAPGVDPILLFRRFVFCTGVLPGVVGVFSFAEDFFDLTAGTSVCIAGGGDGARDGIGELSLAGMACRLLPGACRPGTDRASFFLDDSLKFPGSPTRGASSIYSPR